MKKLLILMILLLINYKYIKSEDMFGYNTIFGDFKHHFKIYNNIQIDSINKIINKSNDKYFNIISNSKPYSMLTFSKMNESQIDSAVKKIEFKQFVKTIQFDTCFLKKLPYSFRDFRELSSIVFNQCDSIISLNGYNSTNSIFSIYLKNCRIKKIPEGIEKLKSFLRLIIEFPDDFSDMDVNTELMKFEKRNNIIDLLIYYRLMDLFPETIFKLTSIQNLAISALNMKPYQPQYEKMVNLINIFITNVNDAIVTSVNKNENRVIFGQSTINENTKNIHEDVSEYIHYRKGMLYHNTLRNLAKENIILNKLEYKNYFKQEFIINFDEYIVNIKQDTVNYQQIKIDITNLKLNDSVTGEINYWTTYELNHKLTFKKNICEIDLSKFKYGDFLIIIKINEKVYAFRVEIRS